MRALDLSKPRFWFYVIGAQLCCLLAEVVSFSIFHYMNADVPLKYTVILCSFLSGFVLFASVLIWLSHYLDYKSDLARVGERRKRTAKILYTNYKNETSEYSIYPLRIYFGSTEFHPESQWLMVAEKYVDTELFPELRTFAMKDIKKWK